MTVDEDVDPADDTLLDFVLSDTHLAPDDNMNEVIVSVTSCVAGLMQEMKNKAARAKTKHESILRIREIVFPSNEDFRKKPRASKTQFRPEDALYNIRRDYLGDPNDRRTPLFTESCFRSMFRVSRSRFESIFRDIQRQGNPFFSVRKDATGKVGAAVEAKILLALKTFAFGVASHAFCDYFQMSRQQSAKCCEEFASIMCHIYGDRYLRAPTSHDLNQIVKLHKEVHKVDGMFGSLDCMHTRWKNCPKAWQGAYSTGRHSSGPTVVLEALCDYHLWFWHASFGYAGSLNDLNILNLSPFLDSLIDGSFAEKEKEAQVVPFHLGDESFDKLFVLVDGIYPKYSRFVKAHPGPVNPDQVHYTKWQESARKDIERAFGVLQGRFKVMFHPFYAHDLRKIGTIVKSVLIMHNMGVEDRVMGKSRESQGRQYDPMANFDNDLIIDLIEEDYCESKNINSDDDIAIENGENVGLRKMATVDQQNILNCQKHWRGLDNELEHSRLMLAIINLKWNQKTNKN